MGQKMGRVGIKGNDGNIARAKRKGKLPFNANIPHGQTLIRNSAETDNYGEKEGKFTMVSTRHCRYILVVDSFPRQKNKSYMKFWPKNACKQLFCP